MMFIVNERTSDMSKYELRYRGFLIIMLFIFPSITSFREVSQDDRIISYTTTAADVELYWKDTNGQTFKSIGNLKMFVERQGKQLKFAMNGGMYKPDNSPQGLFVQGKNIVAPLDTLSGKGNFYMKPNGVFYITEDNKPVVCKTPDFIGNEHVRLATQSGPMLVVDGEIHPAFKKGSANLNIRNGVGILPDSRIVFAMSKQEINFYDFAEYFKKLGCRNALYLDGFVSRMYLPEKKWEQLDGNFGVIIGITE